MEAEKIKIITQDFGELEIEKEHIFTFEGGILGFDELHQFVLISDESTEPLKWLISVENPEIGFPLISPWHIDLSYEPGRDYDPDTEVAMTVVTLGHEEGNLSVNLKAPILFNIENNTGKQLILPTDKYSPSHVIKK